MTHTKFLGLVLNENLSWSFHIDSISRKIAKSIGILYRARHYLNLDSLKNLYYSFIYSHISYGTLIWGSNYKSKHLPIHLLQKRALRATTFTDHRTPSRPLFQRLDILNIFEIVKLQLSELAYRHNTNQLPEVFFITISVTLAQFMAMKHVQRQTKVFSSRALTSIMASLV